MDKNQSIGLILISLLLIVYLYFTPKPEQEVQTQTDSTKVEQTTPVVTEKVEAPVIVEEVLSDSMQSIVNQSKYGAFSMAATGTEKDVILENEELKITFTSKGATVKEVELKKFKTYDQKPLILLDEHSSKMTMMFKSQGKDIDMSALYFKSEVVQGKKDEGGATAIFILELSSGKFIKKTFVLPATGYELSYGLDFQGLDNVVDNGDISFTWDDKMKRLEKEYEGYLGSKKNTTINYYTAAESFEDLDATSSDNEEEVANEPVKWAGIKQKFFTSALIADSLNFKSGKFSTSVDPNDTIVIKNAALALAIPMEPLKNGEGHFRYYFGPNNFQMLKKVTDGFSKNVDLGWSIFAFVNRYLIIPVFNFLEKYISNYGIIIIILVFFIKLLLFPLTYKSYMSMAKMKVMKPELDELKKKYPDDMQKQQQEQMKLYGKVGVSPLSGCLPMVLQMPVLFAMFRFFPHSVELRQESFLWAHDLSTFDSVLQLPFEIPFYGSHVSLFTLLMTLSTILYTWSNNQVNTVQGPMKNIGYFMPITFMFMLNSYPSGLTFYYFVSNIVTFSQQMLIRKFVDEDKIRKTLDENRKKNANKKKSGFKLRLEEAMKAAQENQKKGAKPKKKR